MLKLFFTISTTSGWGGWRPMTAGAPMLLSGVRGGVYHRRGRCLPGYGLCILPDAGGKTEMRSYDEKIPLKYGLVGQETCGARRLCLRNALPGGHEAYGGEGSLLFQGHLDFKLHQSGRHRRLGAGQDVSRRQAHPESLRPALFPDEELRQDSGRPPGEPAGQVLRPEPLRLVYRPEGCGRDRLL